MLSQVLQDANPSGIATPSLFGTAAPIVSSRSPPAPGPGTPTGTWYPKAHCTFSDAIAAVRRQIWQQQICCMSRQHRDVIEIPRQLWERAANALAYAA